MTSWLTADPVQSATLRRGERPRRGHRCEPRSKTSPPWPEAGGRVGAAHAAVDLVRALPALRLDRYPPRPFIFRSLTPPCNAISELFILQRLRLRVVLPPVRERLFVVPDSLSGTATGKKQHVGLDARIWREYAIWQPHNRVEVEILQQLFLDPGAYAVTKQRSVRHDNPRTSWLRRPS
jgi:hypothetical protein